MKNFSDWRSDLDISSLPAVTLTQEAFAGLCREYFSSAICGDMKTYAEHRNENIVEAVETSRYAIEVNYRTTAEESLEGFAKICLGYVSAAMKNHGFHTKHVFDEKPLRLLVSSRNWDNGEWVGSITWHPDHSCFVVSKGFYNKDRRTVSLQHSSKCTGKSAADLTRELHNVMHHLKGQPDRQTDKFKPVPLKRGPKS